MNMNITFQQNKDTILRIHCTFIDDLRGRHGNRRGSS